MAQSNLKHPAKAVTADVTSTTSCRNVIRSEHRASAVYVVVVCVCVCFVLFLLVLQCKENKISLPVLC